MKPINPYYTDAANRKLMQSISRPSPVRQGTLAGQLRKTITWLSSFLLAFAIVSVVFGPLILRTLISLLSSLWLLILL